MNCRASSLSAPSHQGSCAGRTKIQTLSEAAARIGLDLYALRIEALEVESREQRRRADLLERQVQRALRSAARA